MKPPDIQFSINTTGARPYSGVYFPDVFDGLNVAASLISAFYFRINNIVHLSVGVNANPVATGMAQFEISLPFPSNFVVGDEANGVIGSVTGEAGLVNAQTTTNRILVTFIANDTALHTLNVQATYRII